MQARAAKAEREMAEQRRSAAVAEQRRRMMAALSEAEKSRSQLLCDKAAAEHDCAQVAPTDLSACSSRRPFKVHQ